jgi:hypothetical protein
MTLISCVDTATYDATQRSKRNTMKSSQGRMKRFETGAPFALTTLCNCCLVFVVLHNATLYQNSTTVTLRPPNCSSTEKKKEDCSSVLFLAPSIVLYVLRCNLG